MLVKLGVVASVASILARSGSFRRLFFAERRRPRQTLALLAFFLVPLTLGVWIRLIVPNFLAADISFETIVLLGLLIGPGWAMLGDRKSTRLNSSHSQISYAVFCLKK